MKIKFLFVSYPYKKTTDFKAFIANLKKESATTQKKQLKTNSPSI